MLGLDVTIDTKSGFCFGVEFAIEIAEEVLKGGGRAVLPRRHSP